MREQRLEVGQLIRDDVHQEVVRRPLRDLLLPLVEQVLSDAMRHTPAISGITRFDLKGATIAQIAPYIKWVLLSSVTFDV